MTSAPEAAEVLFVVEPEKESLLSTAPSTRPNIDTNKRISAVGKNTKPGSADEKPAESSGEALPTVEVGMRALFRLSSTKERVFIFLGVFCAVINGLALPAFSILFGELFNSMNKTEEELLEETRKVCLILFALGVMILVACAIGLPCFMYTAELQTRRMREQIFHALLRHDLAWHDRYTASSLSSMLTEDTMNFQKGIGEKVYVFVQHMTTFITGILLGVVWGWHLAIVMVGCTPILAAVTTAMAKSMNNFETKGNDCYRKAGDVADSAFLSMHTVAAFGVEKYMLSRYAGNLDAAKANGITKAKVQGWSFGATFLVMFGTYAVCLWFGVWLIRKEVDSPWTGDPYTGGDVMTIFFSMMMGAMSLGQLGPCITAVTSSKSAATRLFAILDHRPDIDTFSDQGTHLPELKGDIVFENVAFSYATRSQRQVYGNLSFHIPAGSTAAFVGESGCGKSTVVKLVQRLYDVNSGCIKIDGHDIKSLNLKWLRSRIGVVSQEPVLFDMSIRENIELGLEGLDQSAATVVSQDAVEQASKASNAHAFITALPEGYDTRVGEGGGMMSGGQKQRIAIARAVVHNPCILILDEATSALDNESEKEVQAAIDANTRNRTTLIVAHRLTTVQNADLIFVLGSDGAIREHGSPAELLANPLSAYSAMFQAQSDMATEAAEATPPPPPPSPPAAAAPVATGVDAKDINNANKGDTCVVEEKAKPNWKRATHMLSPSSVRYCCLGTLGSLIAGIAFPLFSIPFGDMGSLFYETDAAKQESESITYAMMFLSLGFIAMFAEAFSFIGFGVAGERLTLTLRSACFAKMIQQPMAWFDDVANAPRVLTTRLNADAALVKGGAFAPFDQYVRVITALIVGITIAFFYGWKLAFVMLAAFPLLTVSGAMQYKYMAGFSEFSQKSFEKASIISGQALDFVATVAASRAEQVMSSRFSAALATGMTRGLRKATVSGFGFGFSNSLFFFMYGGTFWYGAHLIEKDEMTFGDCLKVIFSLMFASFGAGQAQSMLPDMEAAANANLNIFKTIDLPTQSQLGIDVAPTGELVLSTTPPPTTTTTTTSSGNAAETMRGGIEFKKVSFTYPTRPNAPIFKSLSFSIEPGSFVGLVGASGSGKSTIFSILLRLYDIENGNYDEETSEAGQILIDGRNITSYDLRALRSAICIVSQEPIMFDDTIEANIRFGDTTASQADIEEAAQAANVHTWILSQPDAYQTIVGPKGGRLSGGQKQRVAIARALLRKPRILLLDEATSALDRESEEVVQKALLDIIHQGKERAKAGGSPAMTVLAIAHRLTTVEKADSILVLGGSDSGDAQGSVLESGDHASLMARNGVYAELVRTATA